VARRYLSETTQTVLVALGILLFLGWSLLPPIGHGIVHTPESKSESNLRQLGVGCQAYANDHDDKFPDSLDALISPYPYIPNRSVLVSPFKLDEAMGYTYTPGLKKTSSPDLVLIEDKFAPALKHERIVVYVDGRPAILKLAGIGDGG
jgi:hypothetical protein